MGEKIDMGEKIGVTKVEKPCYCFQSFKVPSEVTFGLLGTAYCACESVTPKKE